MAAYKAQQWSYALALLGIIAFVICFFWGNALTDPALKELHLTLMRLSFPGFVGMDGKSFIIGAIQSAIWGGVIGWALTACLNKFNGK